MWKCVRDRTHCRMERSRRDKARWDEERRAWLAQEERTGEAVRRYLGAEAISTDLQEWAAVGWKGRRAVESRPDIPRRRSDTVAGGEYGHLRPPRQKDR